MSAAISFVSAMDSQQYPARGPVFFAVGTDFGRFSTLSRSVFNIVKDALLCSGMIGEGLGIGTVVGTGNIEEGPAMGTVVGADGIEEGPGTGTVVGADDVEEGPGTRTGWESDTDSVGIDEYELVMR